MKIMEIYKNFVHWDATPQFPTMQDIEGRFAPDIVFVEAPDYVFEGWGYDETAEGDARFIKPEPPEGWVYDEKTGTFYPEGEEAPKTIEERVSDLENNAGGGNADAVYDELAAAYEEGVQTA